MRKVSIKQYQRLNKYRAVKKDYIKGKDCAVCGRPAINIHHGKGRTGDDLFDTDYFIPVCDGATCHTWIETNPAEAKKLGLSFNRLY